MTETRTESMTSPDQPVARTELLEPRRRIFLHQGVTERIASILWAIVRALLFRLTPVAAHRWRAWLLRRFGAAVDSSVMIHPSVRIDYPWNLIVDPDAIIEHKVIINCMGKVRIGRNSRISQYSHLCAGTHDYTDRHMPIVRRSIDIGQNVWVAADAFVGPGVRIGDGSLLAARSSAFGDLPEGKICIGEPARPRRQRFGDTDNSGDGHR